MIVTSARVGDVIVEYGGGRYLVAPDGLVREWDAVAEYYSAKRAACRPRHWMERVRALAAKHAGESMKTTGYCVEFGYMEGRHVDNLVVPTMKLAMQTAAGIAHVLAEQAPPPQYFALAKQEARRVWRSAPCFVAVSRLDGVARGSASAELWQEARSPR